MKYLSLLSVIFFTVTAVAAGKPYDENADAKQDIQHALAQATNRHTSVIVVFGANWCGDCQMLDTALKTGASAALVAQDFEIVKVNVGRFDKNLDVVKSYGVPLKKGIPAVVILSPANTVLYVTKEGELSDARKMGDQGIFDFFKRVTASAKSQK